MDEIRKTTGGMIRGTVTDGIASFLGVPYAAAPVGERRFALPAPISWDGERDATVHGATAPQLPPNPGMPDITPITGPGWVPGAEYLTADVRTPTTGDGLPVMVFVHGGAFTIGSAQAAVYDASRLAREGAVVVAVNYRLGVPGFAAIPGVVANRGLHDQIAALRWVQDNAATFGGDPDRIRCSGSPPAPSRSPTSSSRRPRA